MEVDAPARLLVREIVLAGRTEDIGPEGASFTTREMLPELPVGSSVTLVVPSVRDDGTEVELPGPINRVDVLCDAEGDSLSYALEFDAELEV